MNLSNLRQIITEMGLDGFVDLHINDIGYGERRLSIIKENDSYCVYTSSERGEITKRGDNLTEEDACKVVISIIERTRRLADYYKQNGMAEENGFHK